MPLSMNMLSNSSVDIDNSHIINTTAASTIKKNQYVQIDTSIHVTQDLISGNANSYTRVKRLTDTCYMLYCYDGADNDNEITLYNTVTKTNTYYKVDTDASTYGYFRNAVYLNGYMYILRRVSGSTFNICKCRLSFSTSYNIEVLQTVSCSCVENISVSYMEVLDNSKILIFTGRESGRDGTKYVYIFDTTSMRVLSKNCSVNYMDICEIYEVSRMDNSRFAVISNNYGLSIVVFTFDNNGVIEQTKATSFSGSNSDNETYSCIYVGSNIFVCAEASRYSDYGTLSLVLIRFKPGKDPEKIYMNDKFKRRVAYSFRPILLRTGKDTFTVFDACSSRDENVTYSSVTRYYLSAYTIIPSQYSVSLRNDLNILDPNTEVETYILPAYTAKFQSMIFSNNKAYTISMNSANYGYDVYFNEIDMHIYVKPIKDYVLGNSINDTPCIGIAMDSANENESVKVLGIGG